MTEEQKAEEWCKENMDCCKTDNSVNQPIPYFSEEERCIAKSAFLAGYHEGFKDCAKARLNVTTISDCPIKDEWHDLEKDQTDLPEEEKEYVVKIREYGGISVYIGRYWKEEKMFTGSYFSRLDVIKWKEIE